MAVSQKNLHSVRTNQVSAETLSRVQAHLNRAIEAVWLTAAFLVPLIVLSENDFSSFTELPKITLMRSLAGTGLILWLMATAVGIAKTSAEGTTVPVSDAASVRRWLLARPIEVAAGLVLTVTAISTALSIQPVVSALGAEWGRDGYDLHTTAAYVVLFFLAASRIRSKDQLIRLWVAISATGLIAALIGIAQHFALSPFGISGTYQHQRVTGTVGNPLFLGALLTITLPMGVALALAGATGTLRKASENVNRRNRPSAGTWFTDARIWWVVVTLIVWIHVYASLLTASRGPWLGIAAGLMVLVALTFKTSGLKIAGLAAASIFAGVVLALFIVIGPASNGIESFAAAEQQQLFDERAESGIAIPGSEPSSALSAIERRGKQGTIETRITIWETAGEIATDRPTLPESNNAPWIVRQIFGYGPDTFRFVFPVYAPGHLMGTLTSAAHNDPINRLVEIGLAGLLSYVLLLFATVFVLWRLIIRAAGEYAMLVVSLAVGAGAAVAGRLVEQISGVAEVSDTTVIWLIMAMLAAAYAFTVRAQSAEAKPSGGARAGSTVPSILPALAFSLIAVGIALTGYLIWTHNINLLRSDMEFRKGEIVLDSDIDQALLHMRTATELNPGVEEYQHARAEILQARANLNVSFQQRTQWLQEAYEAEREAYLFNPTSRAANFELAFASWELAQIGDGEKALETLQTYERLAVLAPEHPLVIQRLEQLELALDTNTVR